MIFKKVVGLSVITALIAVFVIPVNVAEAAALTSVSDNMSRLVVDGKSDHAIQFTTPTGITSGQTIVITMPADFDGTNDAQGALDFNDVDLFVDATPDTVCDGTAQTLVASGASSSQWDAVFSGTENRVLTLTSGGASATAGAGNQVCVMIGENASGGAANSQYSNPSTNGSKEISIAAGADSGTVTVNILSDDQVQVSATVAQSITFSISDNSIGFGTLSASGARYATGDTAGDSSETEAHTLVVGTNAANGYTMTVNGTTLTAAGGTIDAIGSSNTASSVGTEQFGLRMTATGGSGAVTAPYAAAGFAFDTAAFPDQVASAAGSSANTTYSVRYLANITSSTEAGSYSATLNYVATANY